jgi:hypothetical protein
MIDCICQNALRYLSAVDAKHKTGQKIRPRDLPEITPFDGVIYSKAYKNAGNT